MENISLLLAAVVERAASDYIDALCKHHEDEITEVERFFKSDYFNVYTRLSGTYLMEQIKNMVILCNYDQKTITNYKNGYNVCKPKWN